MDIEIKPHHRALGFGLGVAIVAVFAARVGRGAGYKLASFGDFHTVVKGGIWAELGLAIVGFLLGVTIWRRLATTHPPTALQSIGLVLITSMAIGIVVCLVTPVAYAVRSPVKDWTLTLWLSAIIVWPYFLFTIFMPLVALMATWTAVWRFICAGKPGSSRHIQTDKAL